MDSSVLRRELLGWYRANRRGLPWRTRPTPYAIWISEIMAQQTQMSRVVPYFERFIARFPDIAALAAAPEDEVLALWEGLGYYRRAHHLMAAARQMMERHGGRVPGTHGEILALPGVGPYTAAAIASMAFGLSHAVCDANVQRVLARLHDFAKPVKDAASQAFLQDRAQALLPPDDPGEFNQALMEFGALVCTPKRPGCSGCPLFGQCLALAADTVARRPVPGKPGGRVDVVVATGVLAHQGRVYIQKRRPDDVWPSLWEFPGGVIEQGETPEQAMVRELREETGVRVRPLGGIARVQYSYTKFRVTLHGFFCGFANGFAEPRLHEAVEGRFVAPDELDGFAFPAGHRRLIDRLRGHECFAKFINNS